MKRLKLILLSAFAALTTNIQAQYTYSPIKYKFEEKGVKADGWNEISLQVSPIKLSTTNSLDGTGYSLGYNKVFNIAKGQPLYLVAGANVQYSSSTNKINGEGGSFTYKDAKGNEVPKSYGTSVSNEVTLFDINVPVSVMYDIAVSNSVSVAPYAGIKTGDRALKSKDQRLKPLFFISHYRGKQLLMTQMHSVKFSYGDGCAFILPYPGNNLQSLASSSFIS